MKKRVKISELKAHLSKYLRHVRRGHTVEIMDRDTPVARVVPYEERPSGLVVRPAIGRMRDLKIPRGRKIKTDIVALIREDRDAR
ncbi:MAG TPA: type II toxin-antitoxin system prevent-host-death family antitoxin [Thermoanaerobaculia bacterium]